MNGVLVNPDLPSWLSAWSSVVGVAVAILALILSAIATFRTSKNSPDYAIVSQDGTVLNYRGFENYGLHVALQSVPISDERKNTIVPEYKLSFNKVPSYFEVSTMEGAVVKIAQSSPLEFKLRFVRAGYGDPIVQCNFKVQAY